MIITILVIWNVWITLWLIKTRRTLFRLDRVVALEIAVKLNNEREPNGLRS